VPRVRLQADVDLWLGSDVFRVRTNAGDQITAERAVGDNPMGKPFDQSFHVYYVAFKRKYPDHPCAKAYGTFIGELSAFEELDELEDATDVPLVTSTPPEGSDVSP